MVPSQTYFYCEKKRFYRRALTKKWSPEQIVGYSRKHNIPMVSRATIYQYIREDKVLGGKLYTLLRYKLKHRKRAVGNTAKVGIKDKISIYKRPKIIDLKTRLGEWEVDTIVGKDNKGTILTIVERKTGFLIAEKSEQNKNAKAMTHTLIRVLLPFKEHVCTITTDKDRNLLLIN